MSKWKGFLYVLVYDQSTGDVGKVPALWAFYVPAHMEPGVQKASAAFAWAMLKRGRHKYKKTAPKRPARLKTSRQFLVGTFDPVDRFEVIGALSTTKIEDHDPEKVQLVAGENLDEVYSQLFVNKGLRILGTLNKAMTWDSKGVQGLQEQLYKLKPLSDNSDERSLTVSAPVDGGGEKFFYHYGKQGDCIAQEKALCPGCVLRAKERSRINAPKTQTSNARHPNIATLRQQRIREHSELELEHYHEQYHDYREAGLNSFKAAALAATVEEVAAQSRANKSWRKEQRKVAGPAGSRENMRHPPIAPRVGDGVDHHTAVKKPPKPRLGKRQREQWYGSVAPDPDPEDDVVSQSQESEQDKEKEHDKEQGKEKVLEHERELYLLQQAKLRNPPLLMEPKPQRLVKMLLPHGEERDFSGLGVEMYPAASAA